MTKDSKHIQIQTVLIVITLALSLVNLYGIFNMQQGATALPAAAPGAAPEELRVVDIGPDDDTIKGDPNAPVTIIEFSDFECPYCARFYEQTLPQLEEEYIKTGKVKLVYRDLPLPFHANAQKAAEAAECAGEQEQYWEMHDKLFETKEFDVASLKQHAVDLGLDTEAFNECLDSGAMADEVKADAAEAAKNGITGTPSFTINGVVLTGAQPFSKFKPLIEKALNE